jgi:autotransporter-associated beta strand protein
MKPIFKMTGLLVSVMHVTVSADVVTSVANNALGENWSLPATWSDGLAPSEGKSYSIVSGFTVRTPEASGAFVFPGDDLRIETGGTLALKARQTAVAKIIGAGGTINHFSNGLTPDTIRLDGEIRIEGNLIINTNQTARTLEVLAPISGEGSITKISAGILVLSGNNTFGSGPWVHGSGTTNRGYIRLASPTAHGGHDLLDLVSTAAGVSGFEIAGGHDFDVNLRSTARNAPDSLGYMLRNFSGDNGWAGDITLSGAGGSYGIFTDLDTVLTLTGKVTSEVETGSNPQTFMVSGSGTTVMEGQIVKGGELPSQDLGLTRTGGGVLVLRGTHDYSGPTRVISGTLLLSRPDVLPVASSLEVTGQGSIVAVPFGGAGAFTAAQIENLLLRTTFTGTGGAFGVDTSAAAGPVIYNGPYPDWAGFAKVGEGVLRIDANYSHNSDLVCAGGVVRIEVPDILLPTSSVTMAASGRLELGANSQSIANLHTGSLGVTQSAITGTGALEVTGSANTEVGPGGTGVLVVAPTRVELDLSELGSFSRTSSSGTFRVGLKSGSNNSTALNEVSRATLADTNLIRGGVIAVGDISANNSGGTSLLRMGRTNTFNTGALNIGFSGRSRATLEFAPGLAAPTLKLRGVDGEGPTNRWMVGNVATFDATTWTALVDLRAGTLDALVNSVEIGCAVIGNSTGRAGIQNSTFRMGAGSLKATNVFVGQMTGSATATATNPLTANGILELDHPEAVLEANTVRLAENTILSGGTGAKTVTGTLRLFNGMIRAGEIRRGDQTGNATATTTFQWRNGTIRNREGVDLIIDGLPIVFQPGEHVLEADFSQVVTVNANSPMSGSGELVKRGAGNVILKAANTRTGATAVEAGRLRLETATLDNEATVSIGSGAVLELAFQGEDEVGGLVIGGVAKAPGTWGAAGSGAQYVDNVHFSGPGVLRVPLPVLTGGYADWAATFAAGQREDEDFDGDGLSNLLEYALLTNPSGSDGSPGTVAGGVISFPKRPEAVSANDVVYLIESSQTLLPGSWTPVTALVDNATTISAALPPGQGRVFLRLRVTGR